ncbi:MAG: peptidylprolyl isomerase [Candidatus Buchananbacteria bacterium]|jgi:hypothetical protein
MPAKKLNLSPEVKSRLRRAVLGGISFTEVPPKADTAAKYASKTQNSYLPPKPVAKTLKKIIIKPNLIAPLSEKKLISNKQDNKNMIESKQKSSTAKEQKKPASEMPKAMVKQVKLYAKKPKVKTGARTVKAKKEIAPAAGKVIPPFSVPPQKIKPLGYKPFATVSKDWEKPEKEESLESLFKGAEKKASSSPRKSFWKFSASPKSVTAGKKHIWLKLAGFIILLAILLFGYVLLGIYKYGFNDVISNQISKTINLPAGFVNNSSIGVGEYMDNLKSLAQPLAMSREGLIDYSGKSDLSDRIFYRLAANKLVAEKLASYNKTITKEELDGQVAQLLKQIGGQAQAEKIINNLYGINFSQFKDFVLIPMLQRSNLQAAIIEDDSLPINIAAKEKANEVLKLAVVSSTDFSILAKQYSDDEASINTGGDLGWVVKGQLDQAWESQIFTAATGTVIGQPIKSGFGYHIVKVEQKLTDKTTGVQSVKLRHILIKVDVDQYIKDLLDSARIVKYISY